MHDGHPRFNLREREDQIEVLTLAGRAACNRNARDRDAHTMIQATAGRRHWRTIAGATLRRAVDQRMAGEVERTALGANEQATASRPRTSLISNHAA